MTAGDYLEFAKASINETHGTHPVHELQTWTQLAIAYALVDIAESLRKLVKAGRRTEDEIRVR